MPRCSIEKERLCALRPATDTPSPFRGGGEGPPFATDLLSQQRSGAIPFAQGKPAFRRGLLRLRHLSNTAVNRRSTIAKPDIHAGVRSSPARVTLSGRGATPRAPLAMTVVRAYSPCIHSESKAKLPNVDASPQRCFPRSRVPTAPARRWRVSTRPALGPRRLARLCSPRALSRVRSARR